MNPDLLQSRLQLQQDWNREVLPEMKYTSATDFCMSEIMISNAIMYMDMVQYRLSGELRYPAMLQ